MNLYPLYLGTGGKVIYIQHDWKHLTAQLKVNMWTRNYVGTIFGGSQFAAADPCFMLMMIHILGKEYIVWDKAGSIEFKKPGKNKCTADFIVTDQEIADIKQQILLNGKHVFSKKVDWIDIDGEIVSSIERIIYVATKAYFKTRNLLK